VGNDRCDFKKSALATLSLARGGGKVEEPGHACHRLNVHDGFEDGRDILQALIAGAPLGWQFEMMATSFFIQI
jgi:K+ transporter